MMSVSRFALAAALALGASAVLSPAPADAQRAPRGQQATRARPPQIQMQGRTLNISAQERTALVALDAAVTGTDAAAQDAALAAARPVVQSADARYAFARYEMRVAIARRDNVMLSRAVDMAIESGMATPEELPTFLSSQATLAAQAGDNAKAERALARLAQLRPGDVDTQIQLAQLRVNQGRVGEGLRTLQAAIAARQQSGQPAPESWHRFGTATAFASRDPAVRAQAVTFARGMVTAYPTPVNWRDALSILREVNNYDAATQLDVWRLMLAAGALAGERDYFDFANTLNSGGYPAEAKAVLDAGVSRRMVDASRSPFRELLQTASGRIAADRADLPNAQRSALAAATGTPALRTADAFLGHARYPEAIALYQAALQKGGVDANVVNTRLGIAYALSNQRAQAEAAFRAVTGPRAEVAAFWMLWLSQRPAG
jgi:tetratricopeptide (TPR) repeat protein